jgi:prepilin-type N-terminal cleavage/methylation domain-containing protein
MRSQDVRRSGFTLPEISMVLVLVATVLGLGWSGLAEFREAAGLRSAARQVQAELSAARRFAVSRREPVRLTRSGEALILTADDLTPLGGLELSGAERLDLDSLRLKPATLRFNARGQAAPGSVYLYKGDRSIRIVCNFLGRLRVDSVRRIS